MIYDWVCKNKECGRKVTITTTKFEHSDDTPETINEDEAIMVEVVEEGNSECKEHKWEKELGGFKLVRLYQGRKGHWIQLVGVMGGSLIWKYLQMI